MIQAALDALRDDLGALQGVETTQVWQGEWDALASGGQVSYRPPATFVSLVEIRVVDVAQTVRGRRQMAAEPGRAAEPGWPDSEVPPAAVPPAGAGARIIPWHLDGAVRVTVDVEIAVTCVASGSTAAARAETALDLAARAIPIMIGRHALRGISGTNLDSPALRRQGHSAVVLVGSREVELDPPGGRQPEPVRVDVVAGGAPGGRRETVFGDGGGGGG